MTAGYDWGLVLLSYLIASVASFTTLAVVRRVAQSKGAAAGRWLAAGSFSMGIGIWSMHFVGMLALRMEMPFTYDISITALSMGVAVLTSALSLFIAARRPATVGRVVGSGIVMGLGIAAMHYTGMAAMRMNAVLSYDPALFAASVVVALVAPTVALWLASEVSSRRGRYARYEIGAALVLGLAISGTHYTGMAAAVYSHLPGASIAAPLAQGTQVWLAVSVSAATLLVLFSTLLTVLFDYKLFVQRKAEGRLTQLVDERTRELQATVRNLEAAEQELRASEDHYRLLFDSNPLPMWVYDQQTFAFLEVNRAAIANYGYSREDFLRMTLLDIRPHEDVPALLDNLRASRPPFQQRTPSRHRRKDGSILDAEVTSHTLPLYRTKAALVVALDVTEQNRARRDLVEARDAAEGANRLKSAFLANMSHEIRTPLTAIIGFAEMLAHEVPAAQQDLVNPIARGGRRLLETLNSVLDLAQLESGTATLHPVPVDVFAEADEALGLLLPLVEEKGLAVQLTGASAVALADRPALHCILNNLVGNAVKFTERGRIDVEVGADEGGVWLRVADTGAGISAEFLPRLFQEYEQESTGHARSHEGNGLGLAITKRLVDLMGGTIEVQSAPGQGTAFTVTLPVASESVRPAGPSRSLTSATA